MAGLQDLLEAYKNYQGVQNWKLGQQMNRVPGAEEAMDLWGGWDTGGLAGAIKTYHGTPRAEPFTRFDSAHMGSGEGAQAFGKGHYLAENPRIAKSYAEMRGPMLVRSLGVEGASPETLNYLQEMTNHYKDLSSDEILRKTIAQLKSELKYDDNPEWGDFYQKAIGELEGKQAFETRKPRASIYEALLEWPGARESVDPMSREHFFQWDRQFSSQPKHIKDALYDIIEQHPDIAEPYAEWLAKHNSPGHTTHSLMTLNPQSTIKAMEGAIEPLMYERGIPGIAFLDQPSRTKKVGDRTHNYVAFGDEIPRIISHNKPSVLDMLWPKK